MDGHLHCTAAPQASQSESVRQAEVMLQTEVARNTILRNTFQVGLLLLQTYSSPTRPIECVYVRVCARMCDVCVM